MFSFLKEEVFGLRHQITFVGKELKIYLPKFYLEKDSAFGNKLGNTIQTIGLFWFNADGKWYELSLPIKISFEYQEEETFKGKLKPELPSQEYDVFVLKAGDAFCTDTSHKRDIEDVETMLVRMVGQGKLPATINYKESLSLIMNLLISSGTAGKLGVSSTIIEILLSELYRNKHEPSEPFRKLLNKSKSASMYDYQMVRIVKTPQLNGIFTSLIGEDTYNQMANIIVRQREGIKDRPTPLEKLLKY